MRMQWSKLKSRIKDRICPELRDRIDFHVTSYRHSHDDADKVWITVDGETLFSYKYYPYRRATAEAFFCGLKGGEIATAVREMEIHSPQDLGNAMRSYLDLSIENALESTNSLIKAFAIIDGRVGKRRLARLEVSEMDHPLVKAFYSLRLAEAKRS
jgi:hypothetical protein